MHRVEAEKFMSYFGLNFQHFIGKYSYMKEERRDKKEKNI